MPSDLVYQSYLFMLAVTRPLVKSFALSCSGAIRAPLAISFPTKLRDPYGLLQ